MFLTPFARVKKKIRRPYLQPGSYAARIGSPIRQPGIQINQPSNQVFRPFMRRPPDRPCAKAMAALAAIAFAPVGWIARAGSDDKLGIRLDCS